ncbi:C40 family peptidase [Ferroacidibacillus organovorans]|uniref:LysM domain-containing protein n=1 Tax=Ferroacidibacillus organovorans TaxID=1765683 RepID=A0A853KE20_9BACL|nr:LysM peptidoglycan-binding domain-containing C40 family peptidase [Ferroacidibacillus organovorans]KYP79918.1 hypothetical protein AYJ22_03200 [Ferroacidibacillus organovorans]OAG94604.1 hypothetical protein AYW79_04415 [Ferroacidibacillus organovorans]
MRKAVVSAVVAAMFTVSLPSMAFAHTKQSNQTTYAAAVNNRSTPQYVTVQRGNTLYGLAREHHTTVRNLTQWNRIRSTQILHIGQRLIVGWNTSAKSRTNSSTTLSSRSESINSNLSSAVLGETIARYATQFQGVPYSWGGESPSGFDCSGLVQFTFGHSGVQLERTSYSQFQQGQSVSLNDLSPGDLVFYDTNGPGASHVGIYVGNGQFIHSGGSHVQIASMNNSYWRAHYIGAKRVTNSV